MTNNVKVQKFNFFFNLDNKKELNYESDGEHLELEPYWRCRRLFNGKVYEGDLPSNCSRPQMDKGRSFSAFKNSFYELQELEKKIQEVKFF